MTSQILLDIAWQQIIAIDHCPFLIYQDKQRNALHLISSGHLAAVIVEDRIGCGVPLLKLHQPFQGVPGADVDSQNLQNDYWQ